MNKHGGGLARCLAVATDRVALSLAVAEAVVVRRWPSAAAAAASEAVAPTLPRGQGKVEVVGVAVAIGTASSVRNAHGKIANSTTLAAEVVEAAALPLVAEAVALPLVAKAVALPSAAVKQAVARSSAAAEVEAAALPSAAVAREAGRRRCARSRRI